MYIFSLTKESNQF